ncbi:hypothetical protein [Actinokineospora diospyrosa]|uniref:Uncharacterized protein n=1 Tax=Actinokineospora diospyrosa TaxID=103728 RepID=A0ABT1IP08_9PSEU|nr:hypothetical protein [Actinokineospora diospyrosa]MCP2274407.1 hypothetical protein [Actinokineospora diospyrosa]
MLRWHPVVLATALTAAAVAGILISGDQWAPWVFLGATAGLATSGST